MKRIFFLFLFLFLFFNSWSQAIFEKAYIVNLSGDTVAGEIRYENWLANPREIRFRSSPQSDVEIYQPKDILSFSVHNEIYISKTVDVETSSREVATLKNDPQLKINKRKVFLNLIVTGEKTLAAYNEYSGNTNFYIYFEGEYQLLMYKKYLKKVENSNLVHEEKRYIGQLMVYLSGCPNIKSKINQTKYTRQSLQKLFDNYYRLCLGLKLEHSQKNEKDVLSFRVIAGLSYTQLNFSGSVDYLAESDFKASTNLSFGGSLDIMFRRSRNRYMIINELIYSSYKTGVIYVKVIHHSYDIQLQMQQININSLFRINVPIKESRLFVNLGLVNAFTLSFQNPLVKTNTINGEVTRSEAFEEYRKWEFGGLIGMGFEWKNWSLEYRYQRSNGMTPWITLASRVSKSFIFLNYRLGLKKGN
jgi:hypothetical protein